MNTRFRPTPTGDLHLGHAYVAAMNYSWAARTGGAFVLMMDDLNAWVQGVPFWAGPPDLYAPRYVEDLTWLGAPPDRVVYSSENVPMQEEVAARCGVRKPRLVNGMWHHRMVPGLDQNPFGFREAVDGRCRCNTYTAFAYIPYYVAVRVADDARWSIDAFVRGMDLVHEVSLYDWFCALGGFRSPTQLYVPLIYKQRGPKQATDHRTALRQLRDAGYDGPAVLDTLLECASRGVEAGTEATMIPEGVLEARGKRRTLAYDSQELRRDALCPARADMPFPAEIMALNAERHEQVMQGQRNGLPDSAPEALRRCFGESEQRNADDRIEDVRTALAPYLGDAMPPEKGGEC